jgi:acetyl-CoA carboxylase carboxyltransferase component
MGSWRPDVLRDLIPENRRRVYDVRKVIKAMADKDSFWNCVPNLVPAWRPVLFAIEGHPFGSLPITAATWVAIEAEGADKAARLMQICNVTQSPGPVIDRYSRLYGWTGY